MLWTAGLLIIVVKSCEPGCQSQTTADTLESALNSEIAVKKASALQSISALTYCIHSYHSAPLRHSPFECVFALKHACFLPSLNCNLTVQCAFERISSSLRLAAMVCNLGFENRLGFCFIFFIPVL